MVKGRYKLPMILTPKPGASHSRSLPIGVAVGNLRVVFAFPRNGRNLCSQQNSMKVQKLNRALNKKIGEELRWWSFYPTIKTRVLNRRTPQIDEKNPSTSQPEVHIKVDRPAWGPRNFSVTTLKRTCVFFVEKPIPPDLDLPFWKMLWIWIYRHN